MFDRREDVSSTNYPFKIYKFTDNFRQIAGKQVTLRGINKTDDFKLQINIQITQIGWIDMKILLIYLYIYIYVCINNFKIESKSKYRQIFLAGFLAGVQSNHPICHIVHRFLTHTQAGWGNYSE